MAYGAILLEPLNTKRQNSLQHNLSDSSKTIIFFSIPYLIYNTRIFIIINKIRVNMLFGDTHTKPTMERFIHNDVWSLNQESGFLCDKPTEINISFIIKLYIHIGILTA